MLTRNNFHVLEKEKMTEFQNIPPSLKKFWDIYTNELLHPSEVRNNTIMQWLKNLNKTKICQFPNSWKIQMNKKRK